jgi:hypothetical protein
MEAISYKNYAPTNCAKSQRFIAANNNVKYAIKLINSVIVLGLMDLPLSLRKDKTIKRVSFKRFMI